MPGRTVHEIQQGADEARDHHLAAGRNFLRRIMASSDFIQLDDHLAEEPERALEERPDELFMAFDAMTAEASRRTTLDIDGERIDPKLYLARE